MKFVLKKMNLAKHQTVVNLHYLLFRRLRWSNLCQIPLKEDKNQRRENIKKKGNHCPK
jgi:hypothetical protein